MSATPAPGAAPARRFGVAYLVMLAVAMVVGSGIFKSPATVAGAAGEVGWTYALWAIGGVLSLLGALTYAELATAYPDAGGDYHFLKRAYGPRVSFLFAWARFAVINTGSIAFLGFTFGDYMNAVLPLGPEGGAIYAAGSVIALTAYVLRGARATTPTDYALTGLEVGGLVLLAAAALWLAAQGAPPATDLPAPTFASPPVDFGLGLVFVMLAFGGWSELATLSAEVKDPQRGMLRGLVGAIVAITLLYLMVNWALLRGLGLAGLAGSEAPAADLIAAAFGPAAAVLTALAIALAAFTSINATIVVGGRTTYAAARDLPQLSGLGGWDQTRGAPRAAIMAQSAMALALVGYGAAAEDGFEALVNYTSPIFNLFLMGTALSVIVLRVGDPMRVRPFRVPLFPLIPLGFAAAAGFMLWSSLTYVHATSPALFGVEWLRLGVVLNVAVMALGVLAFPLLTRGARGGG